MRMGPYLSVQLDLVKSLSASGSFLLPESYPLDPVCILLIRLEVLIHVQAFRDRDSGVGLVRSLV